MFTKDSLPISIKNYTFTEMIGRGATSEVYVVYHTGYNMLFAAKVYKVHEDLAGRFTAELDAIVHLNHPGIIRPYDYFRIENRFVLILEYCPGGSLAKRIIPGEGIDPGIQQTVIKQLVSSVLYCHLNNIAHGDIKPANILVDGYGRIKLADFGFCRKTQDGYHVSEFNGSLVYAAPEIILRSDYDPIKADIWSLGVTIYHLVTGTLPWMANDLSEAKQQIINGNVRYPASMDPRLWSVVKQMLVVDPQKRISVLRLSSCSYLIPKSERRRNSFSMVAPKKSRRGSFIDYSRSSDYVRTESRSILAMKHRLSFDDKEDNL